MTTKSKYQDIKTLDQLNAAIHETRARIADKGSAVGTSFGAVQQFYTPQNLAIHGVRKFAWERGLYTLGLQAVRSLKNLLK